MSVDGYNKIINLFFPNKCAACGKPSPLALCENCSDGLKELELGRCNGCGKLPKNCVCKKKRHYKRCVSAYDYKSRGVASLIYKIKSSGNRLAVNFVATAIVRQIKREYESTEFSAVTYVPIAKIKLYLKGFDHAQLIAKRVAKLLNVPCIAPPIKRVGKVNQKRLNRSARKDNAAHSFILKKSRKIGGTVLLIDDVMTSGATLYRCSELLKLAGADNIYCATAATA